MGRPERPIDPDEDVLQEFAGELRKLREKAGGTPYRRLASRTGYSVTALSEAAGGRRFPSLPVTLAYVTACGADPHEWESQWRAVDGKLAQRARARLLENAPPYLGLAAFQPEDADRFHGREPLVADLLARVRERPFLAVFGPSGSGKSSLLRAGLVASAGTSALPGEWRTVLFTPGEHPNRELASALAARCPGVRLLIVVDQFEEIFTLCRSRDERNAFVRALDAAARDTDAQVRVVIGVRADFYARCAEHPELVTALRDASLLVGPMTTVELTRAVTKPAQQAGLSVDRALVTAVVRDAAEEPGALPLVSHVMLETWLHRRGDTLTIAGYEAAGGVQGALAHTAEQVYTGLLTTQQWAARQVFLRLIALGDGVSDTGRRVSRHELGCDDDAVTAAVVERLVQARLLIRDGNMVQLAHEALIQAWPRLGQWLGENRASLRVHRQLTEAAYTWEALGRESGALYRGVRLALSREWAGEDDHRTGLTAVERDFLDASTAALRSEQRGALRRARLLRSLVAALAVLALVAAGVGAGAVRERQLAQSRELAAEARVEAGLDVTTAARLAVRAYETAPTVPARGALLSLAGHADYQARLTGHDGEIKAVAFTPDNRVLATAGQDRTVILWDTVSHAQLAVLHGHGGSVRALAISPDGKLLAAAGRDGDVLLWDLARRAVLRTLAARAGILDGVAFSPDGKLVAAAGADRVTVVWDVASGATRARLSGYGGLMTEVAFSPDGRTIATADDSGAVALWDLASGRPRVLRASEEAILAVAFSPDGRLLATAGRALTVSVWQLPNGTRKSTFYGHTGSVRGLAFSPDGTYLVSAGYDRQANLWDVVTGQGKLTALTGAASGLYAAAVSPDSRFIAAAGADGTVVLWDRTRLPLIGHTGWASAVAYSHDGRSLATGGNDTTARIWDPDRRTTRAILPASPLRPGIAPDIQSPEVHTVAFSPDDRILATGGDDMTVRLWDAASGVELRRLTGHQARVTSVAFSPDGRLLASAGGADGTVRLWDVAGAAPPQLLQTVDADVESLAFSPDGRLLATGALDETVTLWDVVRREKVASLPGPSAVYQLAISPDGRLLATANDDGTVALWDLRDRRMVGTLAGHRAKLRTVAFSPDGRLLASGGLDQDVVLWDVATRSQWATLSGHGDLVLGLAFSPDSATLASASGDHTVITWTTDPDGAMAQLSAGDP